jgi:hypothetical protein
VGDPEALGDAPHEQRAVGDPEPPLLEPDEERVAVQPLGSQVRVVETVASVAKVGDDRDVPESA